MNWARQTTASNVAFEAGGRTWILVTRYSLRDYDPGTREEIILVVEVPRIASQNGDGNGARRRAEFADFLRKRRASLQPEEVGLANGGRRRTPGLRREEVALLAGVGTTWYTWLEQGRDVRASLDVLEALARALRLTPAERTHLILLGRGEEAPPVELPPERVSPSLRRLIENLGPNPAFILGRRWDYLAWNAATTALFGDLGSIPRAARNHVWLTFMDPARREMFTDWERTYPLMVAKFRADSARHLGEPAFEELIQALRRSSPEFCKAWKRHEVARGGGGRKELQHPKVGLLAFEHAVFHPTEAADLRLILYSPLPDYDTSAKLARLLAAGPADRDAPSPSRKPATSGRRARATSGA